MNAPHRYPHRLQDIEKLKNLKHEDVEAEFTDEPNLILEVVARMK